MNGTTFDDLDAASNAFVASPAVAPLSAQMLAAADHALDQVTQGEGASSTQFKRHGKHISRIIKLLLRLLKHAVHVQVPA